MDAETKTVIKNIAQIQVEALTHISNNLEDTDHDLLKKLLQIKDEETKEVLDNMIKLYKDMEEYPQLIKTLTEYQLFICSHILWKMEEEWITDNSQGVLGAWAIIQKYTNVLHPELTLLKLYGQRRIS